MTTTTTHIPSQAAPVEPAPTAPDLLLIRAILMSDDATGAPRGAARYAVRAIRQQWAVSGDEAVQLIRDATVRYGLEDWAWIIGIADCRRRPPMRPADLFTEAEEVDAATEIFYAQLRGNR